MLNIKPLTLEDFEEYTKKIENYCQLGHIGNSIYCIDKGIYTGRKGWEEFQKELRSRVQALAKLNNHK